MYPCKLRKFIVIFKFNYNELTYMYIEVFEGKMPVKHR